MAPSYPASRWINCQHSTIWLTSGIFDIREGWYTWIQEINIFFGVCEFLVKLKAWLFQWEFSIVKNLGWLCSGEFVDKIWSWHIFSILFQQVCVSMKWIDINSKTITFVRGVSQKNLREIHQNHQIPLWHLHHSLDHRNQYPGQPNWTAHSRLENNLRGFNGVNVSLYQETPWIWIVVMVCWHVVGLVKYGTYGTVSEKERNKGNGFVIFSINLHMKGFLSEFTKTRKAPKCRFQRSCFQLGWKNKHHQPGILDFRIGNHCNLMSQKDCWYSHRDRTSICKSYWGFCEASNA